MPTNYVVNAQGEQEPFSFRKVFGSALRAGASKEAAWNIAAAVRKDSYPGITTSEIFKKVGELLRKQSRKSALRFNLKKSIQQLGPTGFPFEKYVCEIFKSMGFKTAVNQIIPGRCINGYEIDFIAEKENLVYLGECKYRNFFEDKVDLKDALVNFARFLDILQGPCFQARKNKIFKTIMVSNGKFTQSAIRYSGCNKVELLGWKFPQNAGLERLVEEKSLYPITILSSLKGYIKSKLADSQLMLARDILKVDPAKLARKIDAQEKDILSLVREAELLLED